MSVEVNLETYEITVVVDYTEKGEPGNTPVIGENGNWWIGGIDTGLPSRGLKGEPFTYDDFTPEQIAGLRQPAIDAAAIALAASELANEAAGNANSATQSANQATQQAIVAAESANTATQEAVTAAGAANAAATNANTATANANTAATKANEAADLALMILFGGLQAETTSVLQYASTNKYKIPTQAYVRKLDGFIGDLKAFGLWDKLDVAYWTVGDGDLNFKTINIVNPALSGTPVGGLISTPEGIRGNRIDAYVDTNIPINTPGLKYKVADANISAHIINQGDINRAGIAGNTGSYVVRMDNTSSNSHRLNFIGTLPQGLNFSGLGYKSFSRLNNTFTGVNELQETSFADPDNNQSLANTSLRVFSSSGTYSGVGISAFSQGSSIIGQDAINLRQAILNNL